MIDIIIPIKEIDEKFYKTLSSIAIQKNIADVNVLLIGKLDDNEIINRFKSILNINVIDIDFKDIIYKCNGEFVFFLKQNDIIFDYFSLSDLVKKIRDKEICIGQVLNNGDKRHFVDIKKTEGKLFRKSYLEKYNIVYNEDTNLITIENNIEDLTNFYLLDELVYGCNIYK